MFLRKLCHLGLKEIELAQNEKRSLGPQLSISRRIPRDEKNPALGPNQETFPALGQDQHDNVRPDVFQKCYGPVADKCILSLLLMTVSVVDILIHCILPLYVWYPTPN